MQQLGLDSLMAIELKNQIEGQLHVTVPVVNLLEGISLAEMGRQVISQLDFSADNPPPSDSTATDAGDEEEWEVLTL